MEVFDRIHLDVIDYDVKGRGLGKVDGAVVFLDGGEIGDKVEVEILKKKKNFYEGKIIGYDKKSSRRVKNPCPYDRCNGCAFLSLERQSELAWKRERVASAVARIGGIDTKVEEVITGGDVFGYRNHMQFHVKGGKLCLYGKEGELIPIRRCLMQWERGNEILTALQGEKWLADIQTVGIRTTRGGEVMVILVGKKDVSDRLLHDAVAFAVEEKVDSLYYSKNKNPRFHYGKSFEHLYGKETIEETLGQFRYGVGAGNFFQINPYGAEAITREVTKNLIGAETVVELYSGIGTITLAASRMAGQVIGNEISEISVDYARQTAENNGVTNVRYIAGPAEKMLPKIAEEETIDGLIVDPPRAGLDPVVVDTLLESKPKQILYVSCNPSTLARDLGRLVDAYDIEKIQPIDMFPHTASVETVVNLKIK